MSSAFTPIINAVVDQITQLGLEYDNEPVIVEKVTQHQYRDTLEDLYRVTVAKSRKPEKYSRWSFSKERVDFLIEIVIQAPHTDDIASLETYASWRERIMNLFDKPPLPGVSEVFELNASTGDFLDRPNQQSMWDLQQLEVTCSITKPY